jgi:hypothetical protein
MLDQLSLTDLQRAYVQAAFHAKLAVGHAEACLFLAQRDALARERRIRMIRIARVWTGDPQIGTGRVPAIELRMKALTGRPAWDTSATA